MATTSDHWEITLLLLDTSKTFDMVKSKDRFDALKKLMGENVLQLVEFLEEEVTLQVKVGKKIPNANNGAPQGDLLSPILFITDLVEAH